MRQAKQYNPLEPITITLTWAQWETVLGCLDFAIGHNNAKMYEAMASLHDKEIAQAHAAEYKARADGAAALHNLIEDACIYLPDQQPDEETK